MDAGELEVRTLAAMLDSDAIDRALELPWKLGVPSRQALARTDRS